MKIAILIATLLAAIVAANAYASMEIEENASNGTPTFRFFTVRPVTKTIGVFGFAVVTKGWGEAYAGLDYNPTSWLDLGLGYGVDTAGDNHRLGAYAIASKGTFSASYFVENDGSGAFNKAFLTDRITKSLTVGITTHKFNGTGPMADYRISKTETLRLVVFPHITTVSITTTF